MIARSDWTDTRRDRLTKQQLAAFMLLIAVRGSPKLLKEALLWSVPLKLLAMWFQVRSGDNWVTVGISEGLTGVVNGVVALMM